MDNLSSRPGDCTRYASNAMLDAKIMTDSNAKNPTIIVNWSFAAVHGLAILVGLMAALFGSQADVSLWESRSALIWGGALLIFGLVRIGWDRNFVTLQHTWHFLVGVTGHC